MYRSGLVREAWHAGARRRFLICASGIAIDVRRLQLGSPLQMIATVPEFIWELGLGIWLIARGFNASSRCWARRRSLRSPCLPTRTGCRMVDR